ncbi:hypothetical protein [Streptomyces sp. DSM 41534]
MRRTLVHDFLDLVSRPVLTSPSAGYQKGTWLDDLIEQALDAFSGELTFDGDPVQALRRLSEADAVRLLTIHKCKGPEVEKVVVLGWTSPTHDEPSVVAARSGSM